jgi:hypothetical protein
MTYQDGWNYVSGPLRYVRSTVSSTATFRGRNPVTLSDDRTLIEADSDSTAIFGIAAHNAADSIYAGECLVEVPTAQTVYAIKIGTSAAASEVSAGQSIEIEKSGNFLIGNEDSQILGDRLGVFGSNASVSIFAQA